jgi:hypothetical protein
VLAWVGYGASTSGEVKLLWLVKLLPKLDVVAGLKPPELLGAGGLAEGAGDTEASDGGT